MAGAGLTDVRVERITETLEFVSGRQRSGGGGPAVLTNPINIGIGTA